jgi:hypothetical protein
MIKQLQTEVRQLEENNVERAKKTSEKLIPKQNNKKKHCQPNKKTWAVQQQYRTPKTRKRTILYHQLLQSKLLWMQL